MKTGSEKPDQKVCTRSTNKGTTSMRRWIQVVACIIGLLSLGTLVRVFLSTGPLKPSPDAQVDPPAEPQSSDAAQASAHPPGQVRQAAPTQPSRPTYSPFQLQAS